MHIVFYLSALYVNKAFTSNQYLKIEVFDVIINLMFLN